MEELKEPKFTDVKEISDEEFSQKLDEIKATRDFKMYGRDGCISVWRCTYTYRNIKYDIALNRYYILGIPISEIKGMNKYTRWFVLEFPEQTKKAVELYEELYDNYNEFLFKDTLHISNEDDTLEQMFYKMVKAAKRDIDEFLDCTETKINKQISSLNLLKDYFKLEFADNEYKKKV